MASNYEQLVKALRSASTVSTAWEKLMLDDAAAIEELQQKWFKSETDATNLTGKLAQAEADIERLNLEIDKRIDTEIELSKSLDAANHQLKMHSMYPFDDEED